MNQEFLRMQKLAGIKPAQEDYNEVINILTEVHLYANYYSKGILKEETDKKDIAANIKTVFSKAGESTKEFLKNVVDLIKSEGEDPVKVLNQASDFVKKSGGFKNAIQKLSKEEDIQEATFTERFKKFSQVAIIVASLLGSSQQLVNASSATIDAATEKAITYATNEMPGTTFLSGSPDQRGLAQYQPQPVDSVDDANKFLEQEIDPPQTTQSSSPSNLEADFDENNVNTGDADLSSDDNTVVSSRTYDVGEYELDDSEKDKAAKDLVDKILEKIRQDIEDNSDKKVESIKISKKIFSSDSNQDNKNSNVANDGSDLGKGRMNTERDIDNKSDSMLKNALKELEAQGIKVEITDTEEIESYTDVEDQKVQKAKDGLTTQSSGTTADIDIEYGDKGKETALVLQYIPVYYDPNDGSTPLPTGDKDQNTQDTGSDSSTPPPPPVSTDSEMERDVRAITNLNRNSQIALLLSRTSPSLSLFRELKLDSARNITDSELNSIADQGTYKGEQTSEKAKQLAKIIRTSRKSPNSIIKAYAKLTGTKAKETRARASITQKGVTGKSASAPIREGFSNFSQLLLEAAIDTILNNIQAPSTQQSAFLAKLVNAMYVGTEGGDVLDPESNEDKNFKIEYDKIQSPLASREKGERYVYLDKKQDQIKTQPDVERIDKIISNNTPLMTVIKRINTQDELASLLTALFIYRDKNGEDLFPQGKQFKDDPSKVRSALFGLNYRLNEEDVNELPFDVKDFISRLEKTTGLLQALNRVNNLEEFHELVLRVILPKVNPSLLKDKAKLKAAIAKAANASKQFADKGKYTV